MQIAIIGHGRAGKDTAAKWLGAHTSLRYLESTSEAAAMLCYQRLREKYGYTSVKEAFDDRANHRREWADIIWKYNEPDGLTLYREMLARADILNGVRCSRELAALQQNLMITMTIWIDRDVPVDPSLEASKKDADIIIDNNGTLDDLHRRLARFARFAKVLR